MSVADSFVAAVTDGPLLVALPVAAVAGLVSFLSPCVLPLVPGYLSYVTGLSGADLGDERPGVPRAEGDLLVRPAAVRSRVVAGSVLFVLGFSLVFVTFATAFGGLGRLMLQYSVLLDRVFGVVTVLVGLAFLGWLPLLQRTKKLSVRPAAGLAGAPLLGIVFGLGWTPCLGPTLAAVYSLALSEATAARGAVLGLAYCLGLGVPFVLVALGARWALGATGFLRRHARTVTRIGGVVLVLVGLLLMTGLWADLMGWLRSWLAATGFAETSL